ncbi:unnamed protein product [Brassica rapa subsp. trilocularis]
MCVCILQLLVTPIIPIARGPQPGWGVWPNVEADEKVGYMEQLIANNHQFTKSMWPGGDCSEPVFIVTPPPLQPEHKKHTVPRKRKDSKLKPRKCSKKRASTTSQRRITRLFAASSSTPVPTNDLLEARVISLEAKVPVLEHQVTSLEATVATLGATNERLKTRVNHLLNRKRKRSTTGSLLSQRLVKHRRKSTPQTPQDIQEKKTDDCLVGSQSPILSQYQLHQHEDSLRSPQHPSPTHQQTDHPSQDHQPPADHDTNNHKSPTRFASPTDDHQTPNTQTPTQSDSPHNSPDHLLPVHDSPAHHSTDHHSPEYRSSNHQSPNHQAQHQQSPIHHSPANHPIVDHHSIDHSYSEHHSPNHPIVDHHSHNHQSLDHCSPNHHSQTPTAHASHQAKHPSPADHPIVDHLIPVQSESPLVSSTRHAPDQHTPAPQTPDHITTPHITTNQQPLEHKSSDLISSTHPSPVHVSTLSSPPTHKPPVDAFNVTQGSHSQNFAQIAILPLFDATPLGKPTSPEVMSGSDPGTCYAPYKPAGTSTPNSTPTKPAVSPQAFSPHCSSPNAFAALKGSTKSFMSSPNRETAKDGKKEEVDKEDTYSGSPDTKVRKIVAEVNVQTAEDEVCELSDSSPAQKNRAHSLSAEEIALHKALNRPDFPQNLLITSPPVDLWSLFSKTLKAARNV